MYICLCACTAIDSYKCNSVIKICICIKKGGGWLARSSEGEGMEMQPSLLSPKAVKEHLEVSQVEVAFQPTEAPLVEAVSGSPSTYAVPLAKITACSSHQESIAALEAYGNHLHLDRMMSRGSRITAMRRMHLTRSPDVSMRLVGGVTIFCDSHTYTNPIRGAVDASGFVTAIGMYLKYVAPARQAQLDAFWILARSNDKHALGEIGLDLPAGNQVTQERFLQYTPSTVAVPFKLAILYLRGRPRNRGAVYFHGLGLVQQCNVSSEQPIQSHCFPDGPGVLPKWQKNFPIVYTSFLGLARPSTTDQKRALREVPSDRLLLRDRRPIPTNSGGQA